MNGNVANCREKYHIIEIITEPIFLRVARKYCQLAPKNYVGFITIMEVVETILVHSVHIYCMMHHIFYVMSYPKTICIVGCIIFLCDIIPLNYVCS